jgi:hypothetical protein
VEPAALEGFQDARQCFDRGRREVVVFGGIVQQDDRAGAQSCFDAPNHAFGRQRARTVVGAR